MKLAFTRTFDKQYAKLTRQRQEATDRAIRHFINGTNSEALRNHALKGEWLGHYSISAGGDLRLHYKKSINGEVVFTFVAVGTHSQLYK